MKFGGLFGGRKSSRSSKKSGSTRKPGNKRKSSKQRRGKKSRSGQAFLPWLLALALVLLIGGVGIIKWSGTGTGQATLLTIGSQKMYAEVQLAVDQALDEVFQDFTPGMAPAAGQDINPDDYDWPAPQLAEGAHVRCRKIQVPLDIPFRQLELIVAQALEPTGAGIIWGQRLFPEGAKAKQGQPDEASDQLRLDLGVTGIPTHTLILYREGSDPVLRWGTGPGLSAWASLAAHGDRPVVALVIDDWGYGKTEATSTLGSLPVPLTMAVLPGLSFSREFTLAKTDLVLPPGQLIGAAGAGQSSAAGRLERLATGCFVEVSVGTSGKGKKSRHADRRREILLHFPMEPQGYPDPDPGPEAVMVGMGRGEIEERLDKALAALDRVTGVNNHMGSAATGDAATMKNLMQALQERGLLFLDSLTSSRSVAYDMALEQGIPALKNRIFLDYDNMDEGKITANLKSLVRAAKSSGFAVGIGHPHPGTARVLAREIPRLAAQGVVFVTVSELHALMQSRAMASQ